MEKKTIYYIGSRYLPELSHPRFGTFKIAEDGTVTLPTPYAESLLAESALLFTDKPSKKQVKTGGSEYEGMYYNDIIEYGKSRGVKVARRKKKDIIADLVKLDVEEAEKKKEE